VHALCLDTACLHVLVVIVGEDPIEQNEQEGVSLCGRSRVAKNTVSYCDTSDSELEFDDDGYERSKTKSFNKKANATNSDSDEFELGPEADTSDSNEFELGPEADTVLSEIESEDGEMISLKRKKNSNVQTQTHEYTGPPIAVVFDEEDEEVTKQSTAAKSSAATKSSAAITSSVGVDERKLAAKPYTTGVVVELTDDKEKRAMNKKIRAEVLHKTPQFKAVLSVPYAFVMEYWKVLLSQMENGGDYTNQLFFGQSTVSRGWRSNTLVKARAKLEIGIIWANVGGRALGETTANSARSAIEVAKRVTSTHSLCISDDAAANDVAVGQVVSTLEAF
jgi:hypothetical protein